MKFLYSIISMALLLGVSMAASKVEPDPKLVSNREGRDICEYVNGQMTRIGTAGGKCGIINIHGREKRANGIDYVGQMRAGIINVHGREKRSSGVSVVDSMNAGIINVIGGHRRVRRHGIGQVGEMHANTVIANGRSKRAAIDHIGTLESGSTLLVAGSGAPAVGYLGAASLYQGPVDLDRQRRDGIGQIGNLHAHTVIANGRVRRDGIGQIGNLHAHTVIANGREKRAAIDHIGTLESGSTLLVAGSGAPAVGSLGVASLHQVDLDRPKRDGIGQIGNLHAHTVIANGRVRRDGIGQVGNMYAGTVIANGRKRRSAIGSVDHVVTGSFQGYGGVETPAVGQIDALKTGSVDTVKSSKGTPAIGNLWGLLL